VVLATDQTNQPRKENQTMRDMAISLVGTAGMMVFVIPYIMGWQAVKALLFKARETAIADFKAAVAQLDKEFAQQREEAIE
jgi:hypothetical protein